MKIDKVLWASSVEYSDFWNINSFVHKKFLGLDCVLLLYGKKNDLDLSEEFGEVVECDFEKGCPKIPQLVFNKWHFTRNEPDTTWLIGDIDQIPLQKEYFVDQLINVEENKYVHLAEDVFQTLLQAPDWKLNRERLVGHYHAAKGSIFTKALNLEKSLREHTDNLIESAKNYDSPVWAHEEYYIPDLMKANNFLNRFKGFSRGDFKNCSVNHGKIGKKICRSQGSIYDESLLRAGQYVDYHCPRPYSKNKDLIDSILELAWGKL
tara:strand:+ start:109 stop:900 length:792 start_codon:yes stop_codon:yes gene_type:complete